jgi:hypothetical protein
MPVTELTCIKLMLLETFCKDTKFEENPTNNLGDAAGSHTDRSGGRMDVVFSQDILFTL